MMDKHKQFFSDIAKKEKMEKEKSKRTYKTYSFEIDVWPKEANQYTRMEKVYVTAENRYVALQEAQLPFENSGEYFQTRPGGTMPYQIGSANFYKDMHAEADPYIKAEKRQAKKEQIADEKAAKRSSGIERARDGLDQADLNKKLQAVHNQSKYIG